MKVTTVLKMFPGIEDCKYRNFKLFVYLEKGADLAAIKIKVSKYLADKQLISFFDEIKFYTEE